MQGGLSNIYNHCILKSITHINKLKYNHITKIIASFDTTYIITHKLDIIFISIYPSVFSGIFNKNNSYLNHEFYWTDRLTNYFKCTSYHSKLKARDIIMSQYRFAE